MKRIGDFIIDPSVKETKSEKFQDIKEINLNGIIYRKVEK